MTRNFFETRGGRRRKKSQKMLTAISNHNFLLISLQDTSLSIKTPEGTPEILRLNLNPRVTFPALFLIWAFIIWCIVDDEAQSRTNEASKFITEKFTWLYIGSQVSNTKNIVFRTCFIYMEEKSNNRAFFNLKSANCTISKSACWFFCSKSSKFAVEWN